VLPSSVPCPGFSLSSNGSSRVEFPAFFGRIEKLRLLMLRPTRYRSRARFVTSGVSFPCSSRSFTEPPGSSADAASFPGLELVPAVAPFRSVTGEHQVSQVPRRALYEHAPLFDPGPVVRNRFSASACCLPLGVTASADGRYPLFRGSITRPVHSLCTLHVTGRPVPRNTRFQPGTTLCWTGFDLSALAEGFQLCFDYLIVFPLPKLLGVPPQRGAVRDPAGVEMMVVLIRWWRACGADHRLTSDTPPA